MCKLNRSLLLCVLLLMAAACGPNQAAQPDTTAPQAWIDKPLDGSILPPAGSVEVMFHGADPGGLVLFEVSVDDTVLGTVPAPASDALLYATQAWEPAAPGTYVLKVRAQNTAGVWSEYATVTVTIPGQEVLPPTVIPQPTATIRPGQTVIPVVPTSTQPIVIPPTAEPTQPFNCAQFQTQNDCNQYPNYCKWENDPQNVNTQTCQNR